jgi:hypothetical protein
MTSLLDLEDKAMKKDEGPPFVPSHALILVMFGRPHLLYHQGTDLDIWIEDMGITDCTDGMVGDCSAEKDGLYVWSGVIESWTSYWGEHDCDLKCNEWRSATVEEWASFVAEETVWDHDEMQEFLVWQFEAEKADDGD